jgi:hypothetical protein
MATVTGGADMDRAFRKIGDSIGKAREVRVGFLEGATYPDGTSVAEIAAIQNFGATDIPARPFFSDMIANRSPEWGDRFAKVLRLCDYDTDVALARMGEGIAGQLRRSITDTNAPPLAPSTIARKGFDKPLVDTGHMLASVDKEVE